MGGEHRTREERDRPRMGRPLGPLGSLSPFLPRVPFGQAANRRSEKKLARREARVKENFASSSRIGEWKERKTSPCGKAWVSLKDIVGG